MLTYCKTVVLASISFVFFACGGGVAQKKVVSDDPWSIVQEVEASVSSFEFPDYEVSILDFGAVPNTDSLYTVAIRRAIEACAEAGGGKVVVPAGKFHTGAIHLESNINLHLEEGAELLFSTNPIDYTPLVHTSFEGTELINYSPLIYAYKKKNVAITGKGILNGQADSTNWWPWKGSDHYGWQKGMHCQLDSGNRDRLIQMAEDSVPVADRIFGEGYYFRPCFLQPFECENVLIEDVTIMDAPFWVIHPLKCTNVLVDGVTVNSHGPNNDGCDPEYSKNVLIRNATFNTGDDCIAIKSGRDADGRRVQMPSENIVVKNCKMIDGHGGVVIGSEISGGVRNVFVEDCIMDSPNLDRAIRIKTNSNRGATIENVYVRNLEIGVVKESVLKLNMFYGAYSDAPGNFIPIIRNIHLSNIKVKNGGFYGILAKGYKESPISDVYLENVVIEKADKNYSLENVKGFRFIDTYINGQLIQSEEN